MPQDGQNDPQVSQDVHKTLQASSHDFLEPDRLFFLGKRGRLPRQVPRRPLARPKRCRRACDATSTVGRVFGAIFHRFCRVARKLRCAFRISFYSVLLGSSEVSSERACATKRSKIDVFRPSKSSPGASGRAEIEPERASSHDKTRKSRAKLIDLF